MGAIGPGHVELIWPWGHWLRLDTLKHVIRGVQARMRRGGAAGDAQLRDAEIITPHFLIWTGLS